MLVLGIGPNKIRCYQIYNKGFALLWEENCKRESNHRIAYGCKKCWNKRANDVYPAMQCHISGWTKGLCGSGHGTYQLHEQQKHNSKYAMRNFGYRVQQ